MGNTTAFLHPRWHLLTATRFDQSPVCAILFAFTGTHGTLLPLPEEIEPLSRIIQELNERFGIHLSEDVQNSIRQLQTKLTDDPELEASVRVNTQENARLTFNHVVNDRL